MASGYVSYSPSSHFNFQIGHGKHFVGDGYRSLLLSDNAFNYPYLRITSSFQKFQYTNIYTVFMNLNDGGVVTPAYTERLFQKKVGSFQYLNYTPNKKIQFGVFQGMIWEATDNRNKTNINANYFNPLLFVNIPIYGLNNKNNILLGATFKFKPKPVILIYAQALVDDIKTDNTKHTFPKQGYQVGARFQNLFKVKDLTLQLEHNQVFPYTYSSTLVAQNYAHYNQALAHPLGANFREEIAFINYHKYGLFAELKLTYALIGADAVGQNYGNNIFSSDASAAYTNLPANGVGQGIRTTIVYQDFKLGYLVNPATNFNIILGVINRLKQDINSKQQSSFIYFGIKTALTNAYFDF